VGTRCADHVTPLYPQKLALTSPTGGGRSVGIVRVRTKATEFSFFSFSVVWSGCSGENISLFFPGNRIRFLGHQARSLVSVLKYTQRNYYFLDIRLSSTPPICTRSRHLNQWASLETRDFKMQGRDPTIVREMLLIGPEFQNNV